MCVCVLLRHTQLEYITVFEIVMLTLSEVPQWLITVSCSPALETLKPNNSRCWFHKYNYVSLWNPPWYHNCIVNTAKQRANTHSTISFNAPLTLKDGRCFLFSNLVHFQAGGCFCKACRLQKLIYPNNQDLLCQGNWDTQMALVGKASFWSLECFGWLRAGDWSRRIIFTDPWDF